MYPRPAGQLGQGLATQKTTIDAKWFCMSEISMFMFQPATSEIGVLRFDPTDSPALFMTFMKSDGAFEQYYKNDLELVSKYAYEMALKRSE